MLYSLIARRRLGPQTQWRPLPKAFTSGFRLDALSLSWPAVVKLLGFFNSGFKFSQAYLSLFHHSNQFDFVSLLWYIDWVRESLCEPNSLSNFVLRSLSTVKNIYPSPPPPPRIVNATDRSKAVVPVLFLFCGTLHVLKSCHALCSRVSSFLLALRSPRLGKRELNCVLLVYLFVLYALGFVIFLFLLVSGVGCSLWLWHSLDFSINFCFLEIILPSNNLLICVWKALSWFA